MFELNIYDNNLVVINSNDASYIIKSNTVIEYLILNKVSLEYTINPNGKPISKLGIKGDFVKYSNLDTKPTVENSFPVSSTTVTVAELQERLPTILESFQNSITEAKDKVFKIITLQSVTGRTAIEVSNNIDDSVFRIYDDYLLYIDKDRVLKYLYYKDQDDIVPISILGVQVYEVHDVDMTDVALRRESYKESICSKVYEYPESDIEQIVPLKVPRPITTLKYRVRGYLLDNREIYTIDTNEGMIILDRDIVYVEANGLFNYCTKNGNTTIAGIQFTRTELFYVKSTILSRLQIDDNSCKLQFIDTYKTEDEIRELQ